MAVQVGGGIRDEQDVHEALELGVARVLVGTLARPLADPGRPAGAETARVAVAADVREGTVRAAGWLEDTGVAAEQRSSSGWSSRGVRDFLVTAIERDGTGDGPDTALLAALRPCVPGAADGGRRDRLGRPTSAGGGAPAPTASCIGRALYDGSLTLSEASASAAQLAQRETLVGEEEEARGRRPASPRSAAARSRR